MQISHKGPLGREEVAGLKIRALWVLAVGLFALAGCGSPDEEPVPEPPAKVAERPVPKVDPVLPDLSGEAGERLRREAARADEAGMNPAVFAKVGDSNTEYPQNLFGLGCREVGFGSNQELKGVVARYRKVRFPDLVPFPECEPVNSLSRRSTAAVSGVWTGWLMTPTAELPATGIAPPTDECEPEQSPLDCEIGLLKPRWVLIMVGTNDALLGLPLGAEYRGALERMVARVRQLGPVPVLSTLPPMAVPAHTGEPGEERIAEANRIIRQVARSEEVPLIDLYRGLTAPGMLDDGLGPDGLHLGVYGGEDQPDIMRGSAMLTLPALKYGANRRNLIWLQVLEKLDQTVGDG